MARTATHEPPAHAPRDSQTAGCNQLQEQCPRRDQRDAIEALYRAKGGELWALFYTQCSDRERAGDAVQESLLRLQQQDMSTILDKRAWLLRVGRNWLRDVSRKKANSEASGDFSEHPDPRLDTPCSRMESAEEHRIVREA